VRDDARNTYLTANLPNPFAGLLPGTTRNGANISRQSLLARYPQFGQVNVTTNQGYSTYHSLAIEVDKRFSRGFTVQGGYTWSKFLEATSYLNAADPMPHYVISDQDVPHRMSMSFIYELPFGRGRAFGATAPRGLNAIISGWQIQGIHVRQSGQALTFSSGNILYYGNDINGLALSSSERTIDRWFDTTGFERLSTRQLVSNIRTLSLRFPGLRGAGGNNWDLSVLKNTRITEGTRLELRGEFLNAMNHPLFANPNTDPYNTAFGTVSATRGYARRIQLGVKFIY